MPCCCCMDTYGGVCVCAYNRRHIHSAIKGCPKPRRRLSALRDCSLLKAGGHTVENPRQAIPRLGACTHNVRSGQEKVHKWVFCKHHDSMQLPRHIRHGHGACSRHTCRPRRHPRDCRAGARQPAVRGSRARCRGCRGRDRSTWACSGDRPRSVARPRLLLEGGLRGCSCSTQAPTTATATASGGCGRWRWGGQRCRGCSRRGRSTNRFVSAIDRATRGARHRVR